MSEASKPKLPRVGEILRLKSGGPPMTVTGLYLEDRSVFCRWFWRGRIFRDEFLPEHLEAAEPDASNT
jgi:uncharacterized protein YodC (DUF2158 family)